MTDRIEEIRERWVHDEIGPWIVDGIGYALGDITYLLKVLDRSREALADIAHNTSISVPLGGLPGHHHADNVRRCIGIAARALASGEEQQ